MGLTYKYTMKPTPQWPKDIQEAINKSVTKDITTFSEEDQHSGLAKGLSTWWNELDTRMDFAAARLYLGLPPVI